MDRFNYTQSFGDLGACSDLESLKTVLSSVIEALEKNGISPPPVNANTAAQQDADGNWKYPSSEPPRPWFRFKLTDVFSDGVAPAVVIDSATSELTPGEQVAVTDVLGFYSSGAADDLGYAMVAESTIPGKMQNEVWIMPGVGVPTGTDNYTVKLEDSADDAEYMEAKFEHLDGATYDAGTHQFVYSTVVGSGTSRLLRLFTAIGAGGADTDKLVACSPDDTAGYLEGKLANVTAEEYNSTVHMLVKWYTDNEGSGDEQMVAVVDRDDETGYTRVAEGDSLAYLQDQFQDLTETAYNSSIHQLVYVTSSGTTLRLYTAKDTDTDVYVKIVAGDTAGYLGSKFTTTGAYTGTGQTEVTFDVTSSPTGIRAWFTSSAYSGQVMVSSTDDLDYLEDQFADLTATPYSASDHQLVSVYSDGAELTLYTARTAAPSNGNPGFVCRVLGDGSAYGGTGTPSTVSIQLYTEAWALGDTVSAYNVMPEAISVSSGKYKIGLGVMIGANKVLYQVSCQELDL